MTPGPIEVIVIGFPENKFTGSILPELAKVVADETITIIDGLFVTIDDDHVPSFFELDELGPDSDVASLIGVVDHIEGLLSDEDVADLTEDLAPGSSAAILVFEHTWVKPLQQAIVGAGGVLLESIRIPGAVVSEVQAALADLD